jgi:hypothetical protein
MGSAPGDAVPVVVPVVVTVPVEASPVLEPGRATLQSVGRHDCRWPLGDPLRGGFTLCGQRVARGAYCEAHAEVAYRAARDTSQSLERLARLS